MATSETAEERVGLIVLAAGAGTRMRSATPKPLHTVAGVPMLERVLRAGGGAQPVQTAVVVAPGMQHVTERLPHHESLLMIVQDPPRGTGDAVLQALNALPDIDRAVVIFGDHPLLEPRSVAGLLAGARQSRATVTIASAILPVAAAFGRVARDADGRVIGIIERRDDDPEKRQGAAEINTGMMVLDARWTRQALAALQPSAATGELYLTSLVDVAAHEAAVGAPWPIAAVTGDPDDAFGVNDRLDLARAECRAWERKRERLMRAGVTMRLPETIVVDEEVVVGPDTILLPHCALHGATEIGAACVIGPSTVIIDSLLGDRVIVRSSTVESSRIAEDSDVGPYAHVRANTEIGQRVHVGNFAELKNAHLSQGVKVGHFSYLGDTNIGADANIGAGAITANYDGQRKHVTDIGARAFIGSDTVMRAPVRIGNDARTGAGSVVTKDVPDGATVVGVPARVVRRLPVANGKQTEEE